MKKMKLKITENQKSEEEKRAYLHVCYRCRNVFNETQTSEKLILKDYPRVDRTIIQHERIVILCNKCSIQFDIEAFL